MSHPLPPRARRWLSPTTRLTPLPRFKAKWWKFIKNNPKKLLLGVCYLLHLFLLSFDYFSPTKNIFPRQFFSRPSRIKSSQNQLNLFITGRYVQAPVRLSRRSHSDVYFSSQVYLTLKPQNNLFICPAVAKVHNNTPGEPLCPLSRDAVVGSMWRLQPKKGNDNNVPELKWAEATRRSKLIVFTNLSAAICEY